MTTNPPPEAPENDRLLADFATHLSDMGRATATVKCYRAQVARLLAGLPEHPSPGDVERAVREVATSSSTRSAYRTAWRTFASWRKGAAPSGTPALPIGTRPGVLPDRYAAALYAICREPYLREKPIPPEVLMGGRWRHVRCPATWPVRGSATFTLATDPDVTYSTSQIGALRILAARASGSEATWPAGHLPIIPAAPGSLLRAEEADVRAAIESVYWGHVMPLDPAIDNSMIVGWTPEMALPPVPVPAPAWPPVPPSPGPEGAPPPPGVVVPCGAPEGPVRLPEPAGVDTEGT